MYIYCVTYEIIYREKTDQIIFFFLGNGENRTSDEIRVKRKRKTSKEIIPLQFTVWYPYGIRQHY